jgi:hypothetical protein
MFSNLNLLSAHACKVEDFQMDGVFQMGGVLVLVGQDDFLFFIFPAGLGCCFNV